MANRTPHTRHMITVDGIEKLAVLMSKHMTASEIKNFLPWGRSTINFYMRALKAIHNNEEIPIDKAHMGETTLRDYCERHGYAYNTAQREPAKVVTPVKEEQPISAQDAMNKMMQAFLDLAAEAEAFAQKMREYQNA